MIYFYLAFLFIAMYGVAKLLLPEMIKSPVVKPTAKIDTVDIIGPNESENRIKKLEDLLAEKSRNIKYLQSELQVFLVQVREFDKIKTLLTDEIKHLREQNRIFRSELGLPAGQSKEKSVV